MSTSETLDLFNASSVNELRMLLSNDFDVNERNGFGETPLITAVRNCKHRNFIEELVKSGADVTSKDEWGVSALYSAITKRTKDLKLIELLLENGAEIKGEKPVPDRALEHIFIHNKPCSELLIKYKFLKYHNFIGHPLPFERSISNSRSYYQQYKSVLDINIRPYCYDYYGKFLDQCAVEVLKMKFIQLCNGKTFLDFVSKEILFQNLKETSVKKIYVELNSYQYSVYKEIIATRIGRKTLLKKVEELLFLKKSPATLNHSIYKTLINYDLMCHITQYLHKIDLLNLVIALLVLSG